MVDNSRYSKGSHQGMKTLKNFIKDTWTEIDFNPRKIYVLQLSFAILFLLAIIVTYSGLLYNYSAPQAILQGFDEDSSYGVETAIKTQWFNHNSSVNYGPLYYRIAKPVGHFVKSNLLAGDLAPEAAQFRNVHFQLMFLNLLSVIGIALLLMRTLTSSWLWSVLGASVLTGAILMNQQRGIFLFMAHPELFASFWVASGVFSLAFWVERKNDLKKLWVSSFVWALATLSKLITILFGPAFLYLFWAVDSAQFRPRILYFLKWLIIFYLLIGFPQSWDLYGYIKHLMAMNAQSSLVDWNFLSTRWFPLFLADYWRPIVFMAAISFVVPVSKDVFSIATCRKLFVFILLAHLALIAKKTVAPFSWYTFSFVNVGLVVFGFFLAIYQRKLQSVWPRLEQIRGSYWTPIVFFLVFPLAFPIFPANIENVYTPSMACRPQADKVRVLINGKAQSGVKVYTDPLVPYDRIFPRGQIDSPWSVSWEYIISGDFKVAAFKSGYYNMYLEPGAPRITWLKDVANEVKFYSTFVGQETAIDPNNRRWKKIHQDNCSFEVWERE